MVHTCTSLMGRGDSNVTIDPIRRREGRLCSRTGCVYTLMICGETRTKRRENEIQPFARISVTNTNQKTGQKEEENAQKEWKNMRGKQRGEETVINCHSLLLLAEIQVMMRENSEVNEGREDAVKARKPMITAYP